jgi:hypothetical protein
VPAGSAGTGNPGARHDIPRHLFCTTLFTEIIGSIPQSWGKKRHPFSGNSPTQNSNPSGRLGSTCPLDSLGRMFSEPNPPSHQSPNRLTTKDRPQRSSALPPPPDQPGHMVKNSCDRSVIEFQEAPEAFAGLDLTGGAADPVCCCQELPRGVGVPNRCVSETRGSAETSINELRRADCATPPQILPRAESVELETRQCGATNHFAAGFSGGCALRQACARAWASVEPSRCSNCRN